MTFCTACASPIATFNQSCPTCGALHAPAVALPESRLPGDAPATRSILIRLLYLAPVLLLFAIAGGLVQRHTAQEQWLASAYAVGPGRRQGRGYRGGTRRIHGHHRLSRRRRASP